MFKPSPTKRVLFFIIFDIFISLITLFFAYNLRFNFTIDQIYLDNFLLVFVYLIIL